MRAALIVALLLLAGCQTRTISMDADSAQQCKAACGNYMQRHFCDKADVNYSSVTTRQGEVLFQPMRRDIVVSQNCTCTQHNCWWW